MRQMSMRIDGVRNGGVGVLDRDDPVPIGQRLQDPAVRQPTDTIAETWLASDLVNWNGICAVFQTVEETGCRPADLARAWAIVRDAFDLLALRAAIEDQEPAAPLEAQREALGQLLWFADRAMRWLLHHRPLPLDVPTEVRRLRAATQSPALGDLFRRGDRDLKASVETLTELELPRPVAVRVAAIRHAFDLLPIVDLAVRYGCGVEEVAGLHAVAVERLQIDLLLDLVSDLPQGDRGQVRARMELRADLDDSAAEVVSQILRTTWDGDRPEERVSQWAFDCELPVSQIQQAIEELNRDRADLGALRAVVNLVKTL